MPTYSLSHFVSFVPLGLGDLVSRDGELVLGAPRLPRLRNDDGPLRLDHLDLLVVLLPRLVDLVPAGRRRR